jgi:acyl carrier protein
MVLRKEIERAVISVLSDNLGREATVADLDLDLTRELAIDSDELSWNYCVALEQMYRVQIPRKDWRSISTGRETVELLCNALGIASQR